MFKQKPVTEDFDVNREHQRLLVDREFWTNCLHYVLEEGMSVPAADSAINIADKCLEARRERFPL